MSKEVIRCSECGYCKGYSGGPYSNRSSFCYKHPNQEFIKKYYEENRINRAFGYIDHSKPFGHTPKLKTSPKWCPKKAE